MRAAPYRQGPRQVKAGTAKHVAQKPNARSAELTLNISQFTEIKP